MQTLLYNGKIYTQNEKNQITEALVISKGKILFTGSLAEAAAFTSEKTVKVDLGGKAVFPGFIDAHAHPILGAFFLSGIQLDVGMTEDEIQETIKAYIDHHPDQETYFGQGYPEWIFGSKGPKKEALDALCKEKPIVLLGSSGHEGWCNSKALEAAGIDRNYPDPIPGFHYFERNDQGEPTGHFLEMGCFYALSESIRLFKEEEIQNRIEEILRDYSKMGITAIADCGALGYMEEVGYPLIKKLAESRQLNQRIFGCCFVAQKDEAEDAIERLKALHKEYCIEDMLEINTLKIINDGTLESRTASLTVPYVEDGSLVSPMLQGEELTQLCLSAAENDFDIYIHALGDQAVHETLMTAAVIREKGHLSTRITNAHTECVIEDEIPLFAQYNVIANTTGSWHYGNTDLDPIIGKRAERLFPFGSLLRAGAAMSLGSDFPVDEMGPEPMLAMEIGVTRQLAGEPEALILPSEKERLTVDQMVKGYTRNAAYQLRMEGKIGTIEAGKYADLVVYDKDPYEEAVYAIHDITVAMTIFEGKIVYQNQE